MRSLISLSGDHRAVNSDETRCSRPRSPADRFTGELIKEQRYPHIDRQIRSI
jgi:hypothetical protein